MSPPCLPHVSHRYQRSIGTASVKLESLHAAVGGVICDPEITEIDLDAHTGPMLLLGCDGVWDHFAEGRDGKARRPAVFNKLLFTAYAKHSALPMPTRLTRVAETLVARALTWDRNTSHDNTSILLVHLPS
jgi:serine/threonine protein phosphatase PrpC